MIVIVKVMIRGSLCDVYTKLRESDYRVTMYNAHFHNSGLVSVAKQPITVDMLFVTVSAKIIVGLWTTFEYCIYLLNRTLSAHFVWKVENARHHWPDTFDNSVFWYFCAFVEYSLCAV